MTMHNLEDLTLFVTGFSYTILLVIISVAYYILAGQLKILGKIFSITTKTNIIMATQADMTAALDRIDAATNGVAAELSSIKEQLVNAGLPADVENEVLERLQAAATKLEGIGSTEEGGEGGTYEESEG